MSRYSLRTRIILALYAALSIASAAIPALSMPFPDLTLTSLMLIVPMFASAMILCKRWEKVEE